MIDRDDLILLSELIRLADTSKPLGAITHDEARLFPKSLLTKLLKSRALVPGRDGFILTDKMDEVEADAWAELM